MTEGSTGITLGTVVTWTLIIITVIAVVLGILFGTGSPLIKSVTNFFSLNQSADSLVEVNKDLPFYNEFVKNYKECKLSPATDCFCALTNPTTPDNYVIELSSKSQSTTVILHGNLKQESCGRLSPTKSIKDIQTVSTIIEQDQTYFKNYRKFLFIGGPRINKGIVDVSLFTDVPSLFLYKTELCSTKEVVGDNPIDIKTGIIYKFDKDKTAIISEFVQGMKRCPTVKDAVPADDEFNKLLFAINTCTQGVCPFSIKSSETAASDIPQDYSIILEGQQLNLLYKGTVVKTSNIKNQTCQFTDFRNVNEAQGTAVNKIEFNSYIGIEIYSFTNKVCILPYTPELKKQKDLYVQQLKSSLLIPN